MKQTYYKKEETIRNKKIANVSSSKGSKHTLLKNTTQLLLNHST